MICTIEYCIKILLQTKPNLKLNLAYNWNQVPSLPVILRLNSISLKYNLNSIPKPHTFNSPPLKSSVFFLMGPLNKINPKAMKAQGIKIITEEGLKYIAKVMSKVVHIVFNEIGTKRKKLF